MTLPFLNLEPSVEGYNVAFPDDFIQTELDGGPPFTRADFEGSCFIVNVTWQCDTGQYAYLTAFRRTTLNGGVLPFTMNMIIDEFNLQLYECGFVKGSFSLQRQEGEGYWVNATLFVTPHTADADYDQAWVDVYTAFGDQWPYNMDIIREIANIDWPV